MAIPIVASISGSTLSQVLVASSNVRSEVIIQNDSSSPLYVAFGYAASPSAYTLKLYTDDIVTTAFNGTIYGVWGAATGSARITAVS